MGASKLALSKPKGEAGKSWPAITIGAFVAFGGVLFGYHLYRLSVLCKVD